MKSLSLLFLFGAIFLSCPTYSKNEQRVYKIPFYNVERPPLAIKSTSGKLKGLYWDALKIILDSANIKFVTVGVPKIRARRMFWQGDSVISCCDNPDWRTKPKELEVQLFSEPFMQVESVYVTKKNVNLKDKELKYVLINGFSYKGEEKLKNKTYLLSERKQLEFIQRGRADVAIIDKIVAQYLVRKFKYQVNISNSFSFDNIHIRVRKNHAYLLPIINKSITELKARGAFKDLISTYIGKPL